MSSSKLNHIRSAWSNEYLNRVWSIRAKASHFPNQCPNVITRWCRIVDWICSLHLFGVIRFSWECDHNFVNIIRTKPLSFELRTSTCSQSQQQISNYSPINYFILVLWHFGVPFHVCIAVISRSICAHHSSNWRCGADKTFRSQYRLFN